jgi:DNA-binding PadR family transcriptional regulator
MTSHNQIPEDRDIERLRYFALRKLRVQPVSKRVLSKIANSRGMPSKFMDIALTKLTEDGDVITYVPDRKKTPGPNPNMYKITDLGHDTIRGINYDDE